MKALFVDRSAPPIPRRAIAALRRPAVIVTEVAGIAVASALAASLPQEPDLDEVHAFARQWPLLSRATAGIGLHRIVTSWWFLALVALSLVSLAVVQLDQWRRLARTWGERLTPASFARAQYRREVPAASAPRAVEAPRYHRRGRLAMLGSPIFHLGLIVIVAAGLLRLLTVREAMVRVTEGQTLGTERGGFAVERGGPLSSPLVLPAAVRFDAVRATRYPSGALRQLGAALTVAGGSSPGPAEIAINGPLDVGPVRLYANGAFGTAALLLFRADSAEVPLVAYLEGEGAHARGRVRLPDGCDLRLRALPSGDGIRGLELRAFRGQVLLGVFALAPGSEATIAGSGTVRLVGMPAWLQVRATRDVSRPLFFAGLVVGLVGVVLMFSLVRVDSGVFVQGDQFVVAMKAQRFAPLYADEFEQLAREWMT